MPSSIRKALDELPITLDDTYERILQGIPKQKRQHAHHLFQCMVVAIRPLRVEELGEIFAIEFSPNATSKLVEGWRPEHPEEAVLSTCSTLIAVVDDQGSRIVQFSHFSVKEFLTSDRLQASEVGSIRGYYISLEPAHLILARACLTVLLQLDENVDKNRLRTFPLAFYAAQHWIDHAKFRDVESQILDAMDDLFDPKKPYLAAWTWIGWEHTRFMDDLGERPSSPEATPLYYAVSCGLSRLTEHLIVAHAEDVKAKYVTGWIPLHAASCHGHVHIARLLLDHGADIDRRDTLGRNALHRAYSQNHIEVVRLLLGRGADPSAPGSPFGTVLHEASYDGQADVAALLLQHKVDLNARGRGHRTPLHIASYYGRVKVVRLLLEHGAEMNIRSGYDQTPLQAASECGHVEVVRQLLAHGADMEIKDNSGETAFQVAMAWGHTRTAQLLLEHGAKRE